MIKKYLNIFILIIVFISFGKLFYAQEVFNIDADYILYDENELVFIKEKLSDFKCIDLYIFDNKIEADTFKITKKDFLEEKLNFIPVSNLKRMKPKSFFKLLNKYGFYNNSYSKQKVIFETKQGFFKEEIYSNNKIEVDYFSYKYLFYINNNIPLLFLYKENERSESLFFITILKNKLHVYSFNGFDEVKYKIRKHKKKDEVKTFECLLSYCKIKKKKNLYFLVDKFTGNKVISKGFQSLKIKDSFVFGNKNGRSYIYSCNLNKVDLKNVTTFHYFNKIYLNSIQIIQNNKVYWIDKYGNKSEEPYVLGISICGNEPFYYKNIKKIKNTFYYIEEYYDYREKLVSIDTSSFVIPNNYKEIKFYNNSIDYYYNEDKSINDILFILKNKSNKYSLAKVEKLKGKINIKTILLKDVDSIDFKNNNCKYYKNGLYGYYPQNKRVKYKTLDKFNYYYARFEYPNGKKGWLDKKGNEYFDK